MILKIYNLNVTINNANILHGVDLTIPQGEVHAIMGPNGSGKSTLTMTLAGHPNCQIQKGGILINNENILKLSPNERANKGLFLGFQYPLEIAGVNNSYFLRTIIKTLPQYKNMASVDIAILIEEYMLKLGLNSNFLKRDVNDGFSGGEKKRNEIIQMIMLKPKISILDEIDSGLDIDGLKFISMSIKNFLKENPQSSVLLVTHYSRLFRFIKPKKIHIMIGGKIVKSGNIDLVRELEIKGYHGIY